MSQDLKDGGSLLRPAEYHTSGDNATDVPETPNKPTQIADEVSNAYGSIQFLYGQAIATVIWIIWNMIPHLYHFDPYPFGFLATILTAETTFLGIFILISGNRAVDRDRSMIDETRLSSYRSEASLEQLNIYVQMLISNQQQNELEHDKRLTDTEQERQTNQESISILENYKDRN